MENSLKPLAKSVLVPLGLTVAASAIDAIMQEKIYGSGMTALIILNEEMEDVTKLDKYLEESGLLINDISETIKNESKEQKKRVYCHVLRYISCKFIGKYVNR